MTSIDWHAHLAKFVTGWHHEDGTCCPSYMAPANHERLWCPEHQQYVIAPETPPDPQDGAA